MNCERNRKKKKTTKETKEGGISMVGLWETVVGITDAWWRLVPFPGWPQITDIKHTACSRCGGPGNWLPHCHMLAAISLRWWCIYTFCCSLLLYTWQLSANFGAEDPPKYVLANLVLRRQHKKRRHTSTLSVRTSAKCYIPRHMAVLVVQWFTYKLSWFDPNYCRY